MLARFCSTLFLLALAAMVSACQSPSSQYLVNGIGASLPAPDIDKAGKLQNAYFNYLCQQAGIVTDPFGDKPGKCQVQAMDAASWNLIVRQGMNDIDRRCDAYLEWLDNRQRSAGPLRNQLRDLQGAVQGIMFAVDPGSAAALEIVGLAFGLIDRSLQNYNSRLLNLVEPSTRNSVVLNALRDFRRQVRDQKLEFSNRPDAEYALREYMRRCLPFAIEAQINDLSTLGSQGVSPRNATTIFEAPVALGLLRDTPKSSQDPIRRTQDGLGSASGGAGDGGRTGGEGPVMPDLGGATSTEKRFSLNELEALQLSLCVPVSGKFDVPTREGISKMQDGLKVAQTGQISGNTLKSIALAGPEGCEGYRDAFEKFRFRQTGTKKSAHLIRAFQTALKDCAETLSEISNRTLQLPAPLAALETGSLDANTRTTIDFVLERILDTEPSDETGALTSDNIRAIGTCRPKA